MTFSPVTKLDERIETLQKGVRAHVALASDNALKLNGGRAQSIYHHVHSVLDNRERNTSGEVEALQTLERAIATYQAMAETLRRGMDVETRTILAEVDGERKEQSDAEVFFSNRYALFVAGKTGLTLLGEMENTEIAHIVETLGEQFQTSRQSSDVAALLSGSAADLVRRSIAEAKTAGGTPDEALLRSALRDLYTTWVNQFSWPTYADIAQRNGVDGVTFTIGNNSITAGQFKTQSSEVTTDSDVPNFQLSDVIGTNEIITRMGRWQQRQRKYDFNKRKAPLSLPPITMINGEPGTGKSFTAYALLNYHQEQCRRLGIPSWVRVLNTTKFASTYQNGSANNLHDWAMELLKFDGLVNVFAQDAHNMFIAQDDPHITPDQRQFVSVFFSMFDGTLIPKDGRVRFILDMNYTDKIDKALMSRIADDIITVKRWEEPEPFAEYARIKIFGRNGETSIEASEWAKVGQYILDSNLNNRNLDNVFRQFKDTTLKEEEDPTLFESMSYDAIDALVREQRLSITSDDIVRVVQAYKEREAALEEQNLQARAETERRQMLANLQIEQINQPHYKAAVEKLAR
jgi:DNA polymerase III delta prime subunit